VSTCQRSRRPRRVVERVETERGAREAIERLYRERGGSMWRAILGYSADPEIASDAVAETFAQLLRRGADVRDPERWAWRATFRIAAGELKSRRREGGSVPDRAYEIEPASVELANTLATLSDRQRSAVVLHYIADKPVAEVAAILGTTSGTVKVHLSRARRRLREELGEQG
jgi:RNA polymerase sigma-70 factor (ECF subfamily)